MSEECLHTIYFVYGITSFSISLISGLCGFSLSNKLIDYFNLYDNRKLNNINYLLDKVQIDSQIRLLENKVNEMRENRKNIEETLAHLQVRIEDVKRNINDQTQRGKFLAALYKQEEDHKNMLTEMGDYEEDRKIEIEELHEKYDTISDMLDLSGDVQNIETILHSKTDNYKMEIKALNDMIECKNKLIERLENKSKTV